MAGVYDFSAKTIDGKEQSLAAHDGKVLLIVNVASKCGFTPQYKGLEALYRRHRDAEAEIRNFCALNYDVTFPMYAKIDVNGDAAHPLYRHLKKAAPGLLGSEAIKWNFTKFLVDRKGEVVKRYAPTDTPESLEKDVAKLL
jgi:glutathione peroxidase